VCFSLQARPAPKRCSRSDRSPFARGAHARGLSRRWTPRIRLQPPREHSLEALVPRLGCLEPRDSVSVL
jgi:hypothetical protein